MEAVACVADGREGAWPFPPDGTCDFHQGLLLSMVGGPVGFEPDAPVTAAAATGGPQLLPALRRKGGGGSSGVRAASPAASGSWNRPDTTSKLGQRRRQAQGQQRPSSVSFVSS